MARNGHLEVLSAPTDDGWWACADRGRIVFRNGASEIEVAVDGPLRWTRDGRPLTFEDAVSALPAALHGWMALAALVGLRHCLDGLASGVALPAGLHEWQWMARRAAPLEDWMKGLARLDAADVPTLPDGIDDGLTGLEAESDAP
jgi:hypothetical protein